MLEKEQLQKIVVTPYHEDGEDIKGKNTVIKLYSDRLEYKLNFQYGVELIEKDTENKQATLYVDEEGFITRENITSIIKYVGNDIESETPGTRPIVEVFFNGDSMSFSTLNNEERNSLYTKLREWRFS